MTKNFKKEFVLYNVRPYGHNTYIRGRAGEKIEKMLNRKVSYEFRYGTANCFVILLDFLQFGK